LGNVWYSVSGRKDNDDVVALLDGSDHLVYRPETKDIVTWKEREGEKTIVTENAQAYFVEYTEHNVLVSPFGKFAIMAVVFNKAPTEKAAFDALIAQVTSAVGGQPTKLDTTAYAYIGSRGDPAGRRPIKGSDGKTVTVEFDPRRNGKLTTVSGRDLPATVKLTR
jgi:hypothetical protein